MSAAACIGKRYNNNNYQSRIIEVQPVRRRQRPSLACASDLTCANEFRQNPPAEKLYDLFGALMDPRPMCR